MSLEQAIAALRDLITPKLWTKDGLVSMTAPPSALSMNDAVRLVLDAYEDKCAENEDLRPRRAPPVMKPHVALWPRGAYPGRWGVWRCRAACGAGESPVVLTYHPLLREKPRTSGRGGIAGRVSAVLPLPRSRRTKSEPAECVNTPRVLDPRSASTERRPAR